VRTSAKAFVLDPDGRLLLLVCTDPARPGTLWHELPGGGVEPGEDGVAATVREVLEETGLDVDPALVGPVQWTQTASFLWRGAQHLQQHEGRVARLRVLPEEGSTALTEHEVGTVLGQRWWTQAELDASGDRFFPRAVPALLPRLLDGERVDEPFDAWDGPDGTPPAQAARPLDARGEHPVDRVAARVLLLDGDERVLLFRGQDPREPERGTWWLTPGGGLDPGESDAQGAARELFEETGLRVAPEALGAPVHERVARFVFDGTAYRQSERFFLHRVGAHDVDVSGFTPLEVAAVLEHRWWSAAELRASPAVVFPEDLLAVLARAAGGAWC
jgi:8-oxo-dGTP pyrophosphatase MutT (NUDIX family)